MGSFKSKLAQFNQFETTFIGMGNHFNAPIVAYSAFGASKWTTDLVGTPNFASYVPHHYNHYTDRMTFWQRMYNSLTYWFEEFVMKFYFTPFQQEMMHKIFPNTSNWPSLEEIRRNVSLVLLNTHTTLGTPRPYAPNMIEVGGMQIKENVELLSPKIQQFLDGAKNGAIFMSLGSNVLINKMPKEQFDAVVNAFSSYPNYTILIKSDEKVVIPSHKDSDVLSEPWFNQQSILAHKNVKLFVTHGGLLSLTESTYFGKPLVGIPFFFDQHMNMHLAEQKGYGVSVPSESLTGEKLKGAVDKALGNPSYAEQAKLYSDRFRDQPSTPLETAKHWVTHVAKNNGAPHLRSVAVDLPFYALYNLDVWAFILVCLVLFTLLMYKMIHFFMSLVFRSKEKLKNA